MTCKRVQTLLNALVDGQLDSDEHFEVSSHIFACNDCQQRFEQLRQVRSQLPHLQAPPLSDDFDFNLQQKMLAAQIPVGNVVTLYPQQKHHKSRTTQVATTPYWAIAATVAMVATGLSWMLMTDIDNNAKIALEDRQAIIEITQHNAASSEFALVSHVPQQQNISAGQSNDLSDEQSKQTFWTDNINHFNQLTQGDDGYQSFNCGSKAGELGCAVTPSKMVASLPVTSSI